MKSDDFNPFNWITTKKAAVSFFADRQLYQHQIDVTDRQIDRLVYELRPTEVPEGKAGAGYSLTEEEIAVMEGA